MPPLRGTSYRAPIGQWWARWEDDNALWVIYEGHDWATRKFYTIVMWHPESIIDTVYPWPITFVHAHER